jgi:hypothetical protein
VPVSSDRELGTVKGITHHVPLRQRIYTKKPIGWKHEIRRRKSP